MEKDKVRPRNAGTDSDRHLGKFRVLYELAIAMTADRGLEENLQLIADESRQLLDTETSCIALRDDAAGDIFMHTVSGIKVRAFKEIRLPLGKGLGRMVAETKRGYIIDHYLTDPNILRAVDDIVAEEGLVSGMAVPIQMGQKNLGILYVFNRERTTFTQSDLDTLFLIGNLASVEIARKQTEESLRQSEEKYRSVMESSGEPIVVYDQEGRVVYLNPAFTRVFGWTTEELLGKKAPFVPEENWPETEAGLRDVLNYPDRCHEIETRRFTKSGEILDVISSATAYRDRCGNYQGMIANLRDITARKAAEQALRESETKYRLLAENASDVIWVADLDLRFEYISPSVERMFGWTSSEWLSLQPSDFLTQSSLQLGLQVLKDEIEVQRTHGADPDRVRTLELEQYRKDGTAFWTEVSARFLYDDTGSLTGIIGATRNITERRQSQEELQRLFAAVQQAGETIMITEADGTLLYANPAFEKTTGYPIDEVVGKPAAILGSGKHTKAVHEEMLATIRRGDVWRGRFTNKKKDGSLYEETATISPITDESGQVVYYAIVGRDVTSEIMLQRQLYQAQKMEAIGTLAGGIAHDFNNLLQAILGYSDLLLAKKGTGDPDRKKLAVIQQAARDGADLVSRILTFSRKADTKARPIDLNEEIRKALRLLQRTIPRMIDIALGLADNLWIIDADPGQVEQILVNLAINACHAMPEGGQLLLETGNVALRDDYLLAHLGAEPGQYVLLTVSDTGVGIVPDVLERIFDPFFTTKADGEGTGLGLSMVHGIVSQHGGHIKCYSEPGRGTAFRIYFPVSASERIDDVAITREMPTLGTETILLVDDDYRIREMGRQMIETGGYRVVTARSGEEAVTTYSERRSDISLVVLDLIMKGMGGQRCLEELLRIDPNARVLVASGYPWNAIGQAEKVVGARGFISKPYDSNHILTAIREVLDKGHL